MQRHLRVLGTCCLPRDQNGCRSKAQSAKEAPVVRRQRLATHAPLCSLCFYSWSWGRAASVVATALKGPKLKLASVLSAGFGDLIIMRSRPYLSGAVRVTSKNNALDNGRVDAASSYFAGGLLVATCVSEMRKGNFFWCVCFWVAGP
jgi:hypothetical protein